MKRPLTTAWICLLWTAGLPVLCLTADDEPVPPPPPLPGEPRIDLDATQELVLMLDAPIFLRVQLEVDGMPFQQPWRAYVHSLHARADSDGDGFLTLSEISTTLAAADVSIDVRRVLQDVSLWNFDLLPVDRQLSTEELLLAAEARFGGAFQQANSSQAAVSDPNLGFVNGSGRAPGEVLFNTLDADTNNRLTSEEVEAGRQSLHRIDFDVDGNASLSEIEYTRNPFQGQTQFGAAGEGVPLLVIDRTRPLTPLIEQFLQKYGKEPDVSRGERKLWIDSLNLPDDIVARYDRDADRFLDGREVRALFQDPPAAIVLMVRVGRRNDGAPAVEVLENAAWSSITMRDNPAGIASMLVDGNQIEILAGQSSSTQFTDFFQSLFMAYDRDANAYLERTEVQGGQLDGVFAQFDLNHDGMLYADEMLAVVEAESTTAMSRSRLESSNRGRDFFQILDENHDRRINPRELDGIIARIGIWDRNDDAAISQNEIPQLYQLTFDRGRPEFPGVFPAGNFVVSASPVMVTPAPVSTQGPMWFQRMDRNDDGDVSRREFLGTADQFTAIDANGDDLISPPEAASRPDRAPENQDQLQNQ